MTTVTALAVGALYAWEGLWGSFLGVLPLLAFAIGLRRHRRRISSRTRVHVLLGLLLFAIMAGAVTERPLTMGNLSWTFTLPMVATLLLGGRTGLKWTAVVLVAQAVAALCLHYDVFWSTEVRSPLLFQTVRFAGVTIIAYTFSKQTYEHSHALLEQARAADEAKSVFLANISHEIRTPLNGVMGMTEAILQRPLPASERADLEVVHRSGETLLRLINDLLDLTKAERGELPVELLVFDLDQLLRDLMEFTPSKPTVTARLEADRGGTVRGDPTRLRQILANLLSNAMKFTERGEVVLSVRRQAPGQWLFAVSDSGMGMSEATLASLFTPFKQADSSIARRFGGTGLGLALVKTLTQLLGGTIQVSSVLEVGTTFTLTLPLEEATPAPIAEKPPTPRFDGFRVLVVDDNLINLRVAAAMLNRVECEVATADSGEQALETLREKHVDLVLMDLQLPGIDGWEATRQLHQIPGRERVPVIALTASATHADRERSLESGMVDVLTKPLSFAALCERLRRYEARS